jgi:hypothetical protein
MAELEKDRAPPEVLTVREDVGGLVVTAATTISAQFCTLVQTPCLSEGRRKTELESVLPTRPPGRRRT